MGKMGIPLSSSSSSDLSRPGMKRQDTAPPGLSTSDNLSTDAARAAELVNGSHVQHANTVSAGAGGRPPIQLSSLQASRPAPPRPLLTANRPAPPAPGPSLSAPKTSLDHTPSSADLRARQKAHGPPTTNPPATALPIRKESLATQQSTQQSSKEQAQREKERADREWEREREKETTRPPMGAPAKSSPANTNPATQPASGAAGATVGPPPVKPLQPAKKVHIQADDKPKTGANGIAAAAAALEKPKEKEKRISTMTEVQIMEKLRQVVCDDDPKAIYSKIRKVGQG